MERTVCKLVEGPSFRRRVTGPSAPLQVMVTGTPAVMLESSAAVLVISTALATASIAAARRALENCILMD